MRKSHFTLDADIHCALRPDDANQNSSKKSKLIFFLDCAWGSLCVSHSGKIRNLYLKHQSTNQSEANAGKKIVLLQLAHTLLLHVRTLGL